MAPAQHEGSTVLALSQLFEKLQGLEMISARGAISQCIAGLNLDSLSRSVSGSGPNNIGSVCSALPWLFPYKEVGRSG